MPVDLRTAATVATGTSPERAPATAAAAWTSKPGAAVGALNAAILTMIGSSIRGNLVLALGLPIILAACVVGWRAASRRCAERTLSSTYFLLSAAVGVGFIVPSPGGTRPWWFEIMYRVYPAIALAAVAMAAGGNTRQRRRAVAIVVIMASVLYAVTPIALPSPPIDVWNWMQTMARSLLRGVHPYTITNVDSYHGAFDFGSTPRVFPYMPAMIVFTAPAVALLGDYRYALALCLPVAALLLTAAASKIDADPELTAAATLALALHPRGAYMVAFGYPDFLLIAAAGAFLYFAASGRRGSEAAAFLMLPAIKQYVAAPTLLYALARWRRWPDLLFGGAVAAITVIPFLVWNAHATVDGMLYLIRTRIGFRLDSTSLTALVANLTGVTSPRWLGIAAQFGAAAFAWTRLHDRGPGGMLLASALSLIGCFLLATQAFINYYAFVAALFVFAAVAFSARRPFTWA